MYDFCDESNPKILMSKARALVRHLLCVFLVFHFSSSFAQTKSDEDGLNNGLQVHIPNAFTPNSDGRNDFWRPVISGPRILSYNLVVVDRHGNEIFSTTDPMEPWLGDTKRGQYISSPSIFLYSLILNVEGDLENKVYRGHITMVR